MVTIPYIRIPQINIGGIPLTSNIYPAQERGNEVSPTPPTPIVFLTQWKMMGNSQVHTDPYLTQWKVEGNSQIQQYLTQWKVSGNSVVDNNAILSCGDLGQDGKYHVKISNGVDVFDIALTEPLRKVNNIADSIEFTDGVATLTRLLKSILIGNSTVVKSSTNTANVWRWGLKANAKKSTTNFLSTKYTFSRTINCEEGMNVDSGGDIQIFDSAYTSADDKQAFIAANADVEIIFELATPTTEIIQAPQIAVSPTYTSANDVAYSSFTYANPLIYSCGDYSDVDGKYHVKISNGVTIYDIPLTEPLRKVNDVADTIEFVNGVATLTRLLKSVLIGDCVVRASSTNTADVWRWIIVSSAKNLTPNVISTKYAYNNRTYYCEEGINVSSGGSVVVFDSAYTSSNAQAFKSANADVEILFELDTPTTEVIQVSPFPVSPTDTYTSANDTPYSAFEYKKNVEIWSCGEYSAVDGKYHILVQPQGGSIADIALDEPLRKVNDTADSIEFADGVATVTRNIGNMNWQNAVIRKGTSPIIQFQVDCSTLKTKSNNILSSRYPTKPYIDSASTFNGFGIAGYSNSPLFRVVDEEYDSLSAEEFLNNVLFDTILIYELATPTTETIQVPQIEEADSYSCVISQGGKAVSWSSFETEVIP